METFADALGRWHDFYLLTGTAAATLTGLLFVALSFGIGAEIQRRTEGIHTFVTPAMVYLVDVLILAMMAVAPISRAGTLAALLVGLVVVNMARGARRLRRLREFHRTSPLDWRDWLWYLALPIACQGLLALGAAGLMVDDLRALYVVAVALVLLLVTGVRNAWDLVIYLLEKHHG